MANPEGFEFRPANDNEMAQFNRLNNYVFASPATDEPPPSLLLPAWTQCAFKGESLAACSGVYPFVVRMNGKTVPMHGVTGVGTEPEFRRRGLVRQLITDLLHRGKEEGQLGSVLLASRGAIYQRFGYGLASYNVGYEFDPREAVFVTPHNDSGHIRRLSKEEALPHVVSIYKAYARNRNMLALRVDGVWQNFFSDVEKDKAYCIVHFDAAGAADGYCIYSTTWPPNSNAQQMAINDMGYQTIEAYQSMWQFLCSHDLVQKITWGLVPEDDPAPGLLLEPRCLNRTTSDGLWFRVLDVAALLGTRGYDVDGELTIEVRGDEVCPWTNAVYSLKVNEGVADVSVAPNGQGDIVCDVNSLASILSGFATPSWLLRTGRIAVNEPAATGRWDALFSCRHRPSLSFGF